MIVIIAGSKSYGLILPKRGFKIILPRKRQIIRDIAEHIPAFLLFGDISNISVSIIHNIPLLPSNDINLNIVSAAAQLMEVFINFRI